MSFLINAVRVSDHPISTFYLAPTRAWELCLGALLALGAVRPVSSIKAGNAAFAVGLVFIATAVFGYTRETSYPGINALLPTVGTALCIWGGERATLNVVLANRPLVFVGKISYSLYLWHFSLLAFGSYLSVDGLSFSNTVVLIALAAAISIVSWRYIERPFRQGGKPIIGRRQLATASALCMVFFLIFGSVAYWSNGLAGRARTPAMAALEDHDNFPPCLSFNVKNPKDPRCVLGAANAAPQFVLWGDSHAEHFRASIEETLHSNKDTTTSGLLIGGYNCAPILGVDMHSNLNCRAINDALFKFVAATPAIKTVILAAAWAVQRGRQSLVQRPPLTPDWSTAARCWSPSAPWPRPWNCAA